MKAPKNKLENLRFRADLIQRAENDTDLQAALIQKCSIDPIFFFDAFCWTYDPRLKEPIIPFILYPKQEKLVFKLEEWLRRSQEGEKINAFLDKPRDVGATFTVMTWCLQKYLFGEFSARIGSRKEDYVDKKGESDTLFYKLDFNIERIPKWLLPKAYGADCRNSMILKHPSTPNLVAGESANPNFGRGGRKSVTIFDELGFWDYAKSSWESAGESTNFRLAMTTPPETGRDSHTFKLLTGDLGKVEVFEFDWTDVPSRDAKWLAQQRETKSEEELAREVLKSYEGTTDGKVYATEFRLARLSDEIDYDPHLPVFVSWDFGLDTVAMIWWQKDFSTNGLKIIDSYHNSNKTIDFYVPFISGVIPSSVGKTIHKYEEYEKDKIDLHKSWNIQTITHFGDPDVNKRSLKDKESTADVLSKSGITVQSKDWAGRQWKERKEPTALSFRRLEINEKRNEFFISAMRNAKYPKKRENSQSTSEPIKPVHDWTSHFRSSYEYFIDNEPQFHVASDKPTAHYSNVRPYGNSIMKDRGGNKFLNN